MSIPSQISHPELEQDVDRWVAEHTSGVAQLLETLLRSYFKLGDGVSASDNLAKRYIPTEEVDEWITENTGPVTQLVEKALKIHFRRMEQEGVASMSPADTLKASTALKPLSRVP